MKRIKQVMSLFLVLVLLIGCCPLSAFADDTVFTEAEQAQDSEPAARDPTEDAAAEPVLTEPAEPATEPSAPPVDNMEEVAVSTQYPVETGTDNSDSVPTEADLTDTPNDSNMTEDIAEEPASAEEASLDDQEETDTEIIAGEAEIDIPIGETAELMDTDVTGDLRYGGYVYVTGGTWNCTYTLTGGSSPVTRTVSSDHMQIHRIKVGSQTQVPAYCVEPGINSHSGTYTADQSTGVEQDSWNANLTEKQEFAIGLIILYSEMGRGGIDPSTKETDKRRMTYKYEVATQILIWEIVVGYRYADPPYERRKATLYNRYSGYLSNTSDTSVGNFIMTDIYEDLASKLEQHWTVPSFSSRYNYNAPTKVMDVSGSNYTLSLTDTNNVLDRYNFPGQNGVETSKSGNVLSLTAPIGTSLGGWVFEGKSTEKKPNPDRQPFMIWSKDEYQKVITLGGSVVRDPVPAYFKLEAPGGKVTIKKQTNVPGDGAHNVWTFGVYSDAECTNLVETVSTNASGDGQSTLLDPGTYWVKELPGEADLEYWECDTTVHQVTLAAGETAVLTFENNKYGRIRVIKTTNTGRNVSGWQFAVYRDEACTDLVGIRTTEADGTFLSGKISEGDYWVKELPPEGEGSEYWVCETAAKKVTVVQGQTASVTFYNEQYGKISVQKTTNTGTRLDRWQFGIYTNATCTNLVETITTNATGYAESGMLTPNVTYYIKELPGSRTGWRYDTTVTNVTVVPGDVTPAPHVFHNSVYGKIRVHKQTNISGNGPHNCWSFGIYSNAECTDLVGTVTTDQTGVGLSDDLEPGSYWVKELPGSVSPYWVCDSTSKYVSLIGGTTENKYFTNTAHGDLRVIKTTDTGSNLGGWRIGVYTDPACTVPVDGSPFITDDSGLVTTRLPVGDYWVKEIADPFNNTWVYDTTIHHVTLTLGNTTTVNFVNTTRKATVRIIKYTSTGADRGGWVFDIYLGDTDAGSPYCTVTTGDDGIIDAELRPGTYTVKERSRSGWRCEDTNPQIVTVAAGETGVARFYNTHLGTVTIIKHTSTGRDLAGWEFVITQNGIFIQTVVTDTNGTIAVELKPGTYRITEHSRDYWHCDGNSTQEITIGPGENAAVTFHNTHYGRAQIVKTTSTGTSLGGWVFDVYEGTSTSGDPYRTVTTGDDGTILTELLPGTYTVVEREQELSICQGENPRTVTVYPGVTTTVSYHNIIKGRLDIVKTIGEGGSLSGWVFDIYTRSGYADDEDPIFSVTTDINGKASLVLDPGDYIVKERERTGWYCVYANPRNITIVPGEIDTEEFHNEPGPTISIVKRIPRDNIHSGGTVESITNRLIGWTFDIYDGRDIFDYDAETPLATYTTTINDVKLDYTLNELVAEIHFTWMPGIYTIHERERPSWTCTDPWDSRHIVWLTAGYDERVEFVNEDNVSVRLYKLIPAQSGLTQKEIKEQFKGWSFDVYEGYFESVGEAGMDSAYVATYTTNDHGILQYDSYGNISGCLIELSGLTNMQPYTIVERPRDGWYCESTTPPRDLFPFTSTILLLL